MTQTKFLPKTSPINGNAKDVLRKAYVCEIHAGFL